MASTFLSPTDSLCCPFSTAAAHWTIVDDDVVIVAGRVPSASSAERVLARAEHLSGPSRILSDLVIDPAAAPELGALVIVDQLAFEGDSSSLEHASGDLLAALARLVVQYDEVLVWASGTADRTPFEADAAELTRARVAAITSFLEYQGVTDVSVHVELRNRGLVEVAGEPRRPLDRRLAIRLRRSHESLRSDQAR